MGDFPGIRGKLRESESKFGTKKCAFSTYLEHSQRWNRTVNPIIFFEPFGGKFSAHPTLIPDDLFVILGLWKFLTQHWFIPLETDNVQQFDSN